MAQVEVTIPDGMVPGSTFQVDVNGQLIAVQVQPGMKGGQVIRVEVPEILPVITATVVGAHATAVGDQVRSLRFRVRMHGDK